MKLLIVGHTLFERSGEAWLTRNRVGEIANRLAQQGWDVTLIGREGTIAWTTFPLDGSIRMIALRAPWSRRPGLRSWLAACRALVSAPCALVFMPSLFTAFCACLLGRRAVIYTGGSWGLRHDFPRWRGRLELLAAGRVARVVVAGEALRKHFLPRARQVELCIPHVHEEVAERLRAGSKPERRDGSTRMRVLFVGAVNPLKGIRELLEAVDALPGIDFRIVGQVDDEALGSEVAAAADRLPNLSTAGYREWSGLRDDYAWADVFALPSHTEGFPRVLYEAAAFGLALVVTPVGGIPSRLEQGRDALFVEVGEPSSLISALRLLAAEPDTLRRLADAGRETLATSFAEGDAAWQLDRALRAVGKWPPAPGGRAGEHAEPATIVGGP